MYKKSLVIKLQELPFRSKILSEREFNSIYGGNCKPNASQCIKTGYIITVPGNKDPNSTITWYPNVDSECCSCHAHTYSHNDALSLSYKMCD
jgi:hypothetical protein